MHATSPVGAHHPSEGERSQDEDDEHMEHISRRRFLKISAATFGGVAAATQWQPLSRVANAADAPAKGVATIPTFCEMCFWRCGGIAHVRDGKLWKFEGNPKDPQSRGRLCPRGTGAVGAHYDPDRLQKPLIRAASAARRSGRRSPGTRRSPTSPTRMQKIKAEHGPESIALFNHGIGQRFIQHVLKSWGAINFAGPSFAQCRGPRDVGFTLTFGTGLGSPEPTDIENTDCLVLIGSHLGENMHNSQVQEFAQAIERRIPIIVVDPRFSVAASKAKYWLPIKPGTDLALLLAWMNVLVERGPLRQGVRREVRPRLRQVRRRDQGRTRPSGRRRKPASTPALIRATAREFASHRPATIVHPGRRVNWYGDDTQRSRAIALLTALLGNWGRKGGLFLAAGMKIAPYPLPAYPKSDKPQADGSDGAQLPVRRRRRSPPASATRRSPASRTRSRAGSSIRPTSCRRCRTRSETLKAIDKLDLLVVVDTMPSEIAGYADVVLPETTFLERHDELLVGFGRTGWTSLRQPVVRRAARPEARLVDRQAARRQARHRRVHAVQGHGGVPRATASRSPAISWDDVEARRRDHRASRSRSPSRKGSSSTFDTPSKQGRVLVRPARQGGLRSGAEVHAAGRRRPKGHFRLITGRAPVHTFSRTQTNPLLHDLMPENEVWVNAATAATAGPQERRST